MSAPLEEYAITLFLIFARVGACLMVLPGFSSSRVPMQVRLFLAIAICIALSPAIEPFLRPLVREASDVAILSLVASETLVGFTIGLLGRSFMIALQFAGFVIANMIGMGMQLGGPIEVDEPAPALSTLITLTATTLIFILNLHAEVALALVASYGAMPATEGFSIRQNLVAVTDNLDEAFLLCLRVASPFVVYGVVVNFAVGLANKLTPTIPIYFVSLPFVLAGGLVILGYTIGDMLTIFMQEFQRWVLFG